MTKDNVAYQLDEESRKLIKQIDDDVSAGRPVKPDLIREALAKMKQPKDQQRS